MVDASCIGYAFAPYTADVPVDRVRRFAQATGETRPQYLDDAAARAAGYPSLPAPPTYLGSIFADEADPFAWMREIGIDVARVLHAAQAFRYFAPIYAGDRLRLESRITNVLKKSRSRTFVVKLSDVTNHDGVRVAEMRATIIVRE